VARQGIVAGVAGRAEGVPLRTLPRTAPASAAATAMRFDDGRLHLHHGPIDLVIGAEGAGQATKTAFDAAAARFAPLLDELVAELALLRTPLTKTTRQPAGTVARRMRAACQPHVTRCSGDDYVTAMAAVAGAVADEILAVMCDAADLDRAYVNNGGDIALYLNPALPSQPQFSIGICADPDVVFQTYTGADLAAGHPPRSLDNDAFAGTIMLTAMDQVGGVATSGWKGRSHSFGVADLVTVLAPCAAAADVAATLIANAIRPDYDAAVVCDAIDRQPANSLSPDSDLADRLVTVAVDPLSPDVIAAALRHGVRVADEMRRDGLIIAAYAVLQGYGFHCGPVPAHARDTDIRQVT